MVKGVQTKLPEKGSDHRTNASSAVSTETKKRRWRAREEEGRDIASILLRMPGPEMVLYPWV